ncbi:hypothetical protein D3C81_1807770 [compost metagenome]
MVNGVHAYRAGRDAGVDEQVQGGVCLARAVLPQIVLLVNDHCDIHPAVLCVKERTHDCWRREGVRRQAQAFLRRMDGLFHQLLCTTFRRVANFDRSGRGYQWRMAGHTLKQAGMCGDRGQHASGQGAKESEFWLHRHSVSCR